MRRNLLFPVALAANLAVPALCFLYREGLMLLYPSMALLHILLFNLNLKASKRWWQIILLCVIHIAMTFCVHQQDAWLYFHYIWDDPEGRAVAWLGCAVGTDWATVLMIISMIEFKEPANKKPPKT